MVVGGCGEGVAEAWRWVEGVATEETVRRQRGHTRLKRPAVITNSHTEQRALVLQQHHRRAMSRQKALKA